MLTLVTLEFQIDEVIRINAVAGIKNGIHITSVMICFVLEFFQSKLKSSRKL